MDPPDNKPVKDPLRGIAPRCAESNGNNSGPFRGQLACIRGKVWPFGHRNSGVLGGIVRLLRQPQAEVVIRGTPAKRQLHSLVVYFKLSGRNPGVNEAGIEAEFSIVNGWVEISDE